MPRNEPQFHLRIPAELKLRIEAAARKNNRSATAEILARMHETFDELDPTRILQLQHERIEQLEEMLKDLTSKFTLIAQVIEARTEVERATSESNDQLREVIEAAVQVFAARRELEAHEIREKMKPASKPRRSAKAAPRRRKKV